jgi:hypothetical protein
MPASTKRVQAVAGPRIVAAQRLEHEQRLAELARARDGVVEAVAPCVVRRAAVIQ